MSRPATGVLSEEERLAAQGVPPQIIASIRAFNEAAYSRPPSEPAQHIRNVSICCCFLQILSFLHLDLHAR